MNIELSFLNMPYRYNSDKDMSYDGEKPDVGHFCC